MKKMMLIIAVLVGAGTTMNAQTNRVYRTDMQDKRINSNKDNANATLNTSADVRLNSGTNNQETETSLQMNASQEFQGNSVMSTDNPNTQIHEYGNRKWNQIEPDDLPYKSIPYDTSKNNGHCLGCGSGALTDPHLWRR